MPSYKILTPGDPAPWFTQRSFDNPKYCFDTLGGRYIVLCFLGTADDDHSRAALEATRSRRRFFDDVTACFFAVSHDPEDERAGRLADHYPGYRNFWDFDGAVGRLYGALPLEAENGTCAVRRIWVVLDPMLRVRAVIPFAADRSDISVLLAFLDALPQAKSFVGFDLQAPILVLPDVFEPAFCARLIGLYEAHGGEDSGFMREVNGHTVTALDPGHKRRKDYLIEDPEVVRECQTRFVRRVVPMIQRAHQFVATRMERYIVACYLAEDKGHFRAHRDNTTKGTAHRRFAVSINLNDDFAGGEIGFPEFGPRRYKAPPGAAVVFSCSMLHEVSPVTRGRRFVFLPFLYDNAAARIREANDAFVEEGARGYKSGLG